jgi:hypothetical protein
VYCSCLTLAWNGTLNLGNRTAGAVNQKNGTDELMNDDTFQERSLNASAPEASDECGNERQGEDTRSPGDKHRRWRPLPERKKLGHAAVL